MPAPSVPGTIGNFALGPHGRHDPSRTSPSQLPTPAAWRAMRTSRGPGLGTGRRWGVRTEGGPNRSIAAAFIVGGIVDCRAPAALSLSSEGNHREHGDRDSDARKDAEEQDRIVQEPG